MTKTGLKQTVQQGISSVLSKVKKPTTEDYEKMKQTLQKGITSTLSKLERPMSHEYEQQYMNILGEQVSFVPTGIAISEPHIVEFDTFYKPQGITEEDFILLKNTMRILFQTTAPKKALDVETGNEVVENGVYPPCSQHEKDLVKRSLLHRRSILYQQVNRLGIKSYDDIRKNLRLLNENRHQIQGRDSLLARQYLTHFSNLTKFLEDYNRFAVCINTEDKAYKGISIDLDDDKIRELLKQYVFFLLQSKNPLEDYKKTDPTSSAFVARLAKKPLGDKFPTFLKQYQDNKFPIPEPIVQVLEATKVGSGSMKQQVDRIIREERLKIISFIRTIVPASHPFWKKFKTPESLNDITQVIDALWKLVKDCEESREDLDRKRNECDSTLTALTSAKKLVETQKAELERRVGELEAELQRRIEIEGENASLKTQLEQLQGQKTAAEEDMQRRLTDLERQLRECEQARAQQLTRIQELEEQVTQLRGQLDPLRARNAELERLNGLKEAELVELRDQVATLREQLEDQGRRAGEAATAANAALQEKVNELARTNAEVETHKRDIATYMAKIDSLTKQIQEQSAKQEKLAAAVKAAEEERNTVAKQEAECKERLAGLEEEITGLRQRLGDAEKTGTELEELQQQLTTATQSLQAEQTRRGELQVQLKACQDELNKLKQRQVATTRETDGLATEKGRLEGLLDDAKQTIERLQTEVGTLRAQLNDAKEQLQAQTVRANQAQADVGKAQDQAKAYAAKAQADVAKAQADVAKAQADTAKAQADATQAQKAQQAADAARVFALGERDTALRATGAANQEAEIAKQKAQDAETRAASAQKACEESLKKLTEAQQATTGQSQAEVLRLQEELRKLQAIAQEEKRKADEAIARASATSAVAATAEDAARAATQRVAEAEKRAAVAETATQEATRRAEAAETAAQEAMRKVKELEDENERLDIENDRLSGKVLATGRKLKIVTDEKDGALRQASEATSQRDGALEQASQATAEKDAALKQASQATSQRDNALQQAAQATAQRDNASGEAKKATAQKEAALQSLQQATAERDEALQKAKDCEDGKAQEQAAANERVLATQRAYEEATAALNAAKAAEQDALKAIQVLEQRLEQALQGEQAARAESASSKDELLALVESMKQIQADTAQTALSEKTQHGALRDVVLAIASGSDVSHVIPRIEDSEEKEALDTILQRLAEKLTPMAEAKKQEHITMLCHNILLLSFLWRSAFSAPSTSSDEDTTKRQAFVQRYFPTLFNGGTVLAPAKWAAADAYSHVSGLYTLISESKTELGGKIYQEVETKKIYLDIFNKLARSMENAHTQDAVVLHLQAGTPEYVFLQKYIKKMNELIPKFKDADTTSPFHDIATQFPELVTKTFHTNFPSVVSEALDKYIVEERGTFQLVSKKAREAEGIALQSNVNYAVLFYSFLVVMRDYLNNIHQTTDKQCPLPAILKKPTK